MARIRTSVQRRLTRLRNRRQREIRVPTFLRSTAPFLFDASLRLAGIGEHHDEILLKTGITPTTVHVKGAARNTGRTKVWSEDLWVLGTPLGERASLDEHLDWLWEKISPHKAYFASLVEESSWADVCLGCLSESAFPVLSARPSSLAITRELRLGLSFNFTCV